MSADSPAAVCRDCGHVQAMDIARCVVCGSPRRIVHRSWNILSIAHVDCDAFYAAIEKRDNPALRDKPVIVGGGKRGVVATCCYIARLSGVRSAMPMFKALAACPSAVVIKPDMAKYKTVSLELRRMMETLTPMVEPISIDEAFLDLSGTERLHHAPPAVTLAIFQAQVEKQLGITVSIGLAPNKFLAKFASDMDKPRGFRLIDQEEAADLLAPLPVDRLPGVGAASARRLLAKNIRVVRDLQQLDEKNAARILGEDGLRLVAHACGRDDRTVTTTRLRKSISSERTLEEDISDLASLEAHVRRAADSVGRDLRQKNLLAVRVTLKLKTSSFRTVTRSVTLASPSPSTAVLLRAALPLLDGLADGTSYRLIGLGADIAAQATPSTATLFEETDTRRLTLERTVDALRDKFGNKLSFGAKTGAPTRKGGS
jgi:DNA polymerase IV